MMLLVHSKCVFVLIRVFDLLRLPVCSYGGWWEMPSFWRIKGDGTRNPSVVVKVFGWKLVEMFLRNFCSLWKSSLWMLCSVSNHFSSLHSFYLQIGWNQGETLHSPGDFAIVKELMLGRGDLVVDWTVWNLLVLGFDCYRWPDFRRHGTVIAGT